MGKHRFHHGDDRQWGGPALTSGNVTAVNRHVAADAETTAPLPVVRVGAVPEPRPGWFDSAAGAPSPPGSRPFG